ncbi:aldose 1-epimerase family protein [Clostridium grantii]|uniref:Galactose mutarotase n=1 Tax=Clostridium grantii DSM 8605 TaxID=1121316 RepID=A0A1M5X955_9CLOT|nr:aldose 1-epimerase family protein [Clostridium grantii]SHH96054.1 Galactose mutarotase [Clostridium grantii DSM 8605]
MIETIKNEFLSVSVKNHGAELCSLKSLKNNKEYLWQADPQYWGKHSPILFPIIGFLKDNEYIYQGNKYEISKHGFARDYEFQLVEKHDNMLKYIFNSDENTLKKYPFNFELYIIYTLNDEKLDISYEVKNKDNKQMYFSIGAHPAFNCNIYEGDKYLEFEEKETLDSYITNLKNGLMEKGKNPILENEKELLLTYDLFKEDALIFDNIKSNSISIRDDKTGEKVKVSIKGFPYLGIWTPEAPFICIEPWYGLPDTVDSNKQLKDKIGIEKLEGNKTFKANYQVEIIC